MTGIRRGPHVICYAGEAVLLHAIVMPLINVPSITVTKITTSS